MRGTLRRRITQRCLMNSHSVSSRAVLGSVASQSESERGGGGGGGAGLQGGWGGGGPGGGGGGGGGGGKEAELQCGCGWERAQAERGTVRNPHATQHARTHTHAPLQPKGRDGRGEGLTVAVRLFLSSHLPASLLLPFPSFGGERGVVAHKKSHRMPHRERVQVTPCSLTSCCLSFMTGMPTSRIFWTKW